MDEYNKKDLILLAKYKARQETNYAVKQGLIPKLPCRFCGDRRSEAHHNDYTKPYEVVWLCKEHHMDLHYWAREGRVQDLDSLTELQQQILYYLEMDTTMLDLAQLVKDCGAYNIESATLAIAQLVVKGYLKPVKKHEIDVEDVINFFKPVENPA